MKINDIEKLMNSIIAQMQAMSYEETVRKVEETFDIALNELRVQEGEIEALQDTISSISYQGYEDSREYEYCVAKGLK